MNRQEGNYAHTEARWTQGETSLLPRRSSNLKRRTERSNCYLGRSLICLIGLAGVLIGSQAQAQPLPGPCTINFDGTCPNTATLCGADFVGSGGCISANLMFCYSSGLRSFKVTDAMPLTINLSGDLLKLSVFFAGQGAGTGTMTFFDVADAQVGAPISTNGDCLALMPPFQVVSFSQAVRKIEVTASGTVWIDDFTVNPNVCGNGTTESGEECDDGNTSEEDECDNSCQTTICGDGITQGASEECDDGNTDETDSCNNSCQFTSCGDGIVQNPNGNGGNETCDTAGESASCDSDCTARACGDGTLNTTAGEQCDDGNTLSGDLCDQNCLAEQGFCGSPAVSADIASRYIRIEPHIGLATPVAYRIECGSITEWVRLILTDYDDGGGVFVNIGDAVDDCTTADFLTPDEWTSSGANALYVTGVAVAPDSKPTVTAVCVDCAGGEAAPVTPTDPTWVFCDASGDGQVTFVFDLFKQFNNNAATGAPFFTGPDPGIEVDTQGNSPTVPDQQITGFLDTFKCFLATTAGGSDTWSGEACP